MKFAKELEEDLVPEWRVKYFNYKLGKKKIKAVSRALRNANRTPQTPGRPPFVNAHSSDQLLFTHYDFSRRPQRSTNLATTQPKDATTSVVAATTHSRNKLPAQPERRESMTMFATSPPSSEIDRPPEQPPRTGQGGPEDADEDDTDASTDTDYPKDGEEQPLQRHTAGSTVQSRLRYGSIIGSPPTNVPDNMATGTLSALHLPDPALSPSQRRAPSFRASMETNSPTTSMPPGINRTVADLSESAERPEQRRMSSLPHLSKEMFKRRLGRKNDPRSSDSKVKRSFTTLTLDSPAIPTSQADALRELDSRQDDFFAFLDKEFDKIEKFYKTKEEEAASRLHVCRLQLHEMRDRRMADLKTAKQGGKIVDNSLIDGQIPIVEQNGKVDAASLFKPVTDIFHQNGKVGKTSTARQELGTPRTSFLGKSPNKNDRGDYVRRSTAHERVPYRFAKRKLKLALQEFYRGLELLKSYALLNRTAFRKINKKYDKAVQARPPLRYMSEKVNNAHFVQSTFVEETLVTVEDLYARYFERGNRKVAVSKLRSHLRSGNYSSVSFRNGLYVAAGVGLGISGLVNGTGYLFSNNPKTKTEASYLYQIYGGYFLAVLLFLFFILNCRVWTRNRVNYTFVFEYDTRHTLDWRQLAEIPCFFLFLNGLFFWINFQFHEEHVMYRYWPVILIAITVLVIFLPIKALYYTARKWWWYSNWRLLLAGLYPVEFRDFYLGDMYCSETYTMSQMEVFFCLYARSWNDPGQCNSSHSRLLGFLTALPAIWRALQCLRRYYDSRNWFPHLANFIKYCGNIMYYMTLSLYRIHLTGHMKALFIVFALINGLYCSFWDVFMDFSLGNPLSKNFLLRDQLAFRYKGVYYFAMVADVVLRQQWIFYAIFTEDVQHSAITSFLVGLAEVFRRGMWSLFRVENEHCNNVQQFRASRDIPLPYSVPDSPRSTMTDQPDPGLSPGIKRTDSKKAKASGTGYTTATSRNELERTATATSSLRRRNQNTQSTPAIRALQRVGTAIATAHVQDFQKKRDPNLQGGSPQDASMIGRRLVDSSDEEDDDDLDPRHGSAPEITYFNSRDDPPPQPTVPTPTPERPRTHRGRSEQLHDIHEATSPSVSPGGHVVASGSGSGSGSSSRQRRSDRLDTEREERDASRLRRADEENQVDIAEARDNVERARGSDS